MRLAVSNLPCVAALLPGPPAAVAPPLLSLSIVVAWQRRAVVVYGARV